MNIHPVTNHCIEGYYVWNFAILASQYIIISGKTEQGHLLKWEVGVGELIRLMQFFFNKCHKCHCKVFGIGRICEVKS